MFPKSKSHKDIEKEINDLFFYMVKTPFAEWFNQIIHFWYLKLDHQKSLIDRLLKSNTSKIDHIVHLHYRDYIIFKFSLLEYCLYYLAKYISEKLALDFQKEIRRHLHKKKEAKLDTDMNKFFQKFLETVDWTINEECHFFLKYTKYTNEIDDFSWYKFKTILEFIKKTRVLDKNDEDHETVSLFYESLSLLSNLRNSIHLTHYFRNQNERENVEINTIDNIFDETFNRIALFFAEKWE